MKTKTVLGFFFGCALVIFVVGCGGSSRKTPDAGDAAKTQVDQLRKGQFGPEWDSLHPAHQALVSRDQYIACGEKTRIIFDSVTVAEQYDETLGVSGLGSIPTRAVSLTIHVGEQTQGITVHEINVAGVWRWIMKQETLDAFRAGTCPP